MMNAVLNTFRSRNGLSGRGTYLTTACLFILITAFSVFQTIPPTPFSIEKTPTASAAQPLELPALETNQAGQVLTRLQKQTTPQGADDHPSELSFLLFNTFWEKALLLSTPKSNYTSANGYTFSLASTISPRAPPFPFI